MIEIFITRLKSAGFKPCNVGMITEGDACKRGVIDGIMVGRKLLSAPERK